MFDRILRLFHPNSDASEQLSPEDSGLALGALLVRAAKSDGAYLFQELEEIDHILAHYHGLSAEEAETMRTQCETLERSLPSTLELAGMVRGTISADQRKSMIAAMWRIVYADRMEHPREQDLMFLCEDLLGVSHADSLELRNFEKGRVGLKSDTAKAV